METYFPRFSGGTDRKPNQHLKEFHKCMEQQGIFLEDVQMKLFMYSLDEDARVFYRTIPHGSISLIKCFHMAFYHYCKILNPPNALFEDCCGHFNVENIPKVNDPVEDVCGAPLQENIYSHQKPSPNDQESKEGNIVELQINPQRSYSDKFDVSPSCDVYEFNGESSDVEPQQSESWEAAQEEEAH